MLARTSAVNCFVADQLAGNISPLGRFMVAVLAPAAMLFLGACSSGSMSAIAARAMASEGYTNIYNLDGGFRAWEAAGYELIESR